MNRLLTQIEDEKVRGSLRNSVTDGALWAVMFGLAENYIVPFILLFGASVLQTSLVQGISQFSLGFGQLMGAKFINLYRKRKQLVIVTILMHGFFWVLTFVMTVLTRDPGLAIFFFSLGIFLTNFGSPAWASWMNELVPKNIRGAYWSRRNKIVGIFQFFAMLAAGVSLYYAKSRGLELHMYGILFGIACAARIGCALPVSRQIEAPMETPNKTSEFHLHIFITKLRTTNFGRFTLFIMLMNFSVYLAAALIPVYMLRNLHMGYLGYTILTMTSAILTFLFMPYWGPLADRFGNRRILIAVGIVIPFLILGWAVFKSLWVIFFIQVLTGFVWSGFSLCTTNFIYDAVKPVNLPKILAYFNALNSIFILLGSLAGGLLADLLIRYDVRFFRFGPIEIVFLLSFILRLSVFLIYDGRFQEVRTAEASPPLRFFYVDKPRTYISARFKRKKTVPRGETK